MLKAVGFIFVVYVALSYIGGAPQHSVIIDGVPPDRLGQQSIGRWGGVDRCHDGSRLRSGADGRPGGIGGWIAGLVDCLGLVCGFRTDLVAIGYSGGFGNALFLHPGLGICLARNCVTVLLMTAHTRRRLFL